MRTKIEASTEKIRVAKLKEEQAYKACYFYVLLLTIFHAAFMIFILLRYGCHVLCMRYVC